VLEAKLIWNGGASRPGPLAAIKSPPDLLLLLLEGCPLRCERYLL
jgi:hypothetical protein